MANVSEIHMEYLKSDLCNGYGLGVSCVGCCHTYSKCRDLRNLIEVTVWEKRREVMLPPIGEEHFIPPGGYPVVVSYSKEGPPKRPFKECMKEFNEIVDKNTKHFEEQLEKGVSLEEISNGRGFVGKVNGRIGCLLYQHENPEENKFYRDSVCLSYRCSLGRGFPHHDRIMKKFIENNLDNDNFNTLSFSRIVHMCSSHPDTPRFLKITDPWRFSGRRVDEVVKELNTLLKTVTE